MGMEAIGYSERVRAVRYSKEYLDGLEESLRASAAAAISEESRVFRMSILQAWLNWRAAQDAIDDACRYCHGHGCYWCQGETAEWQPGAR